MTASKKAAAAPKTHDKSGSAPTSDDIKSLSLAMMELSASLHEFVNFFEQHPEIKQLPDSLKELTKRISVLSTRL